MVTMISESPIPGVVEPLPKFSDLKKNGGDTNHWLPGMILQVG